MDHYFYPKSLLMLMLLYYKGEDLQDCLALRDLYQRKQFLYLNISHQYYHLHYITKVSHPLKH